MPTELVNVNHIGKMLTDLATLKKCSHKCFYSILFCCVSLRSCGSSDVVLCALKLFLWQVLKQSEAFQWSPQPHTWLITHYGMLFTLHSQIMSHFITRTCNQTALKLQTPVRYYEWASGFNGRLRAAEAAEMPERSFIWSEKWDGQVASVWVWFFVDVSVSVNWKKLSSVTLERMHWRLLITEHSFVLLCRNINCKTLTALSSSQQKQTFIYVAFFLSMFIKHNGRSSKAPIPLKQNGHQHTVAEWDNILTVMLP